MRPCICNAPFQNQLPTLLMANESVPVGVQPMEVQVTRTANDRVPISESGMVLARDASATDSDRVTTPPTDVLSNMPTCCSKCSSVAMENHKTKSKLDQLRLVMQQKKERREARKSKNAPYGMVLGAAAANGAVNLSGGGMTLATKNPHQSTNYANGGQPAPPLQVTTQVQPTTVTNNDSQDSTISLENSSAETSSSSLVVVGEEGSSGSGVALLNESGSEEVVVVVAGDESQQQEEQSNGVDMVRAADAAAVAAEQQQQQQQQQVAEDQKQQQQQNHLVEEVDTAA